MSPLGGEASPRPRSERRAAAEAQGNSQCQRGRVLTVGPAGLDFVLICGQQVREEKPGVALWILGGLTSSHSGLFGVKGEVRAGQALPVQGR